MNFTSPIFSGKDTSLPVEWSPVRAPLWQAPALLANIKLGWKSISANTLAYYDIGTIIALKSFIVQDPETVFLVVCGPSMNEL
jgi:hypothetical protein